MRHWTENDFTEWIYGLKAGSSHLTDCADCSRIAESLQRRKAEATRPPDVSPGFLAEQRRNIYARLDRPRRHWASSRWVLSFAMLLMVMIASFGIFRERPSTVPLATPADEKLFSDLASIDQSNEPRAIQPIENLFEQ
jgi:hypothetical protein